MIIRNAKQILKELTEIEDSIRLLEHYLALNANNLHLDKKDKKAS